MPNEILDEYECSKCEYIVCKVKTISISGSDEPDICLWKLKDPEWKRIK